MMKRNKIKGVKNQAKKDAEAAEAEKEAVSKSNEKGGEEASAAAAAPDKTSV